MKEGKYNFAFVKMHNTFEILPSIYFFRGHHGLFKKGTLVFSWLQWGVVFDLKTFKTKEK